MKRSFWVKKWPVPALALTLLLTTAAFQNRPAKPRQDLTDTVPERSGRTRDIDQALEELENSKASLDRSLRDIDMTKLEKQIREATENIHLDVAKMKAEMEALQAVDRVKMKADLEKALGEINSEKISAETARALKAADLDKIRADVEASVAKIDWDKMNAELKKARTVDMEKIKTELEHIQPQIDSSMKVAHQSLDRARKTLQSYKKLVDGLDQQGLIHKNQDYTISYKKGTLLINGQTQPPAVVDRYQDLLKDLGEFTITQKGNDFNIHKD